MAGTGRGSGMGLMGDKRKIFSLYNLKIFEPIQKFSILKVKKKKQFNKM